MHGGLSRASKGEAGQKKGWYAEFFSGSFPENKQGALHYMRTQSTMTRFRFLGGCNVVNFGRIKVSRNKVVFGLVELSFDSIQFAIGDRHDFFADS
jgi:hypothetical protein